MAPVLGRTRIRVLLGFILIVGVLFSTRLFYLQIVKGNYYAEMSDRQYLKSATTFFNRGSIYFRKKDGSLVSAASLKQEFLLTINPQMIKNPQDVFNKVSAVVTINEQEFMRKVQKEGSLYEELKNHLTVEEAEAIKNLEIPGIFLIKEKVRFYPAGPLAAHALGFMAYQGEEYAGRYGLEQYYEKVLKHENSGSFASFLAEIFIDFGRNILSSGVPAKEGDLILTIEPVVQSTVERELELAIDKWQAESGGVIVMDPRTGDIVAMSAWPDFDPGEKQADISILPNPLVERVFEMGSVFKPLTLAAGLDLGVVTPDTTYYDSGSVTLNGRKIMNHDLKAHGTVDMQEVINNSLNTGAVFVMQKMGKDDFRRYMLAYGFGEKTGIDLPGEIESLSGNLDSNQEVDYATISFGQGIAVTPISITRAFGALAGGGKVVKPRLVQAIRFDDGGEEIIEPEVSRRVLEQKAVDEITEILVNVVDDILGGGQYKLEHHSIAAKTGTAQMVKPNGGYYDDRYVHSFFGYYPAYEPRFVTFMYLVYPKNGSRFASQTLSDPFMNIAKFLINYYELPPDRAVENYRNIEA